MQKKEMVKKTDSVSKPLTEKTLVKQPTLVPASSVMQNQKQKPQLHTGEPDSGFGNET